MLPLWSVARTLNLCLPFLTRYFLGELQSLKLPSSSLHSNDSASAWFASKVTAAFFLPWVAEISWSPVDSKVTSRSASGLPNSSVTVAVAHLGSSAPGGAVKVIVSP